MKNKKITEKKIILILLIAFILSTTIFGSMAIKYKIFYEEAIKQGAENTVTALEMVVACQQLSNVTSEEIQEQAIHNYIYKNTTNEK